MRLPAAILVSAALASAAAACHPVARVAPPPAAAPVGLGELKLVVRMPAWGAALVAGKVVVLEPPGFETLSAYDAATGAPAWHEKFQDEPHGRHSLLAGAAGTVLVWAGNQMIRIDATTGARRSREEVPWNDHCGFVEKGGACAFLCECAVQLAACDSGKPLGQRYEKSYTEFFDESGGSGGCYGAGADFLGGVAGGVAVMTVEDPQQPFGRPLATLGLDVHTGAERWRSAPLGIDWAAELSGVSPDGATCWFADHDGNLQVFDCAGGTLRFAQQGVTGLGRLPVQVEAWVAGPNAGVFRQLEDSASLLDAQTGAATWTVTVSPGTLAAPVGARLDSLMFLGEQDSLALLAPEDGTERARISLPKSSLLVVDPAGGFVVSGDDLVAYDPDGAERARRSPSAPPNVLVRPGFYAVWSDDRLVLLDRADLHAIAEVPGLHNIDSTGAIADGVLLYHFPPKLTDPGETLLLRR